MADPRDAIIDYKVVSGESITEIEQEVQLQMIKGWKPFGGISVVQYSGPLNFYYCQAMIKTLQ